MTREEVIKILYHYSLQDYGYSKEDIEAFTMAVKALEKEPCEDCISRQSAITAMLKIEHDDIEKYGCSIPEGFDAEPAIDALNNLPSVIPEQKKEVKA